MTGETKSGAQRVRSLRPRCIGAVEPRIRVPIYLEHPDSKEGLGKVSAPRLRYFQLKLLLCCNFTYLRQEAIFVGGFLVIYVTKTTNGLILTCFSLLFCFILCTNKPCVAFR
jgi:hypothetical protein